MLVQIWKQTGYFCQNCKFCDFGDQSYAGFPGFDPNFKKSQKWEHKELET